MAYVENLSQALSPYGFISPQTLNGATATSTAVDMSLFKRVLATIMVGAITGSITAKLRASAAVGSGYADVTGTTITAITTANKQAEIELRADQMPANTRYVELTITEGNSSNALVSGLLQGGEAAQKPASNSNPAAVVQVLTVSP